MDTEPVEEVVCVCRELRNLADLPADLTPGQKVHGDV
jgi:hypothetical protein